MESLEKRCISRVIFKKEYGENQQARRKTMNINKNDTAVVVIDPQNDVLSEKGVSWDLVGESVKDNKTIENIERIFKAAKQNGFEVFISPHYYYPTDHNWKFAGNLEQMMLKVKEFDRRGALSLDGFLGSGADWLDRYKPFIEDGKTIVASPHKVYGPQTNDLVLQLRKRNISKVILLGMLANLCVEAHLRELLEQGFEVLVVKDATAAPRHPELGDGYKAALINFGYIANAVLSTDEVVAAME
ncbi:MAG: cysteine hydrolase [Nostoc sp.]